MWHILLIIVVAVGSFLGCTGAHTGNPAENEFESAFVDDFERAGESSFAEMSAGTAKDDSLSAEGIDESGAFREVEESDIYRFSGERLYVLNKYRGLFVFDVSDLDKPIELGRVPLYGEPVEMYVRGDRVYAILTNYLEPYQGDDLPEGTISRVSDSRVVAIDLSNPEQPKQIGEVSLNGIISDSRLVGEVIYAISSEGYGYYEEVSMVDNCYRDSEGDYAAAVSRGGSAVIGSISSDERELTLTSIDISDPSTLKQVEQLTVNAPGQFVHATDEAFVIAGVQYGDVDYTSSTALLYIDITDPGGKVNVRGRVSVSGEIQDDTALDMYAGQLRVLTREWESNTTKLRILDATDPDSLPIIGELEYFYEGDVYGTTFDGDRLYMIHYQTTDPLEVVDMSDPTEPVIAGILEMPGWVDRIAALGDRLIGLGIDDSAGQRKVSVSLFDVSDSSYPELLDRISTGDGWSSTLASWERKAWSVDEEAGLILFPYESYGPYLSKFGLGILEFSESALTPRGELEAPAEVERGIYKQDHIFALSQAVLQVVNIANRDDPRLTTTIDLAPNNIDYIETDGAGVTLTSRSDWGGPNQLRISILSDIQTEVARLDLERDADFLIASGDLVVAMRIGQNDWWCTEFEGGAKIGVSEIAFPLAPDGEATEPPPCVPPGLTIVSVANPEEPKILADLDLPSIDGDFGDLPEEADGWIEWQERYGAFENSDSAQRALRLAKGRLGFIHREKLDCYSESACQTLGIEAEVEEESFETIQCDIGTPDSDSDSETLPNRDCEEVVIREKYVNGHSETAWLHVLDLEHEGGPRFLSPYKLERGGRFAFAADGMLLYSHMDDIRSDETGRQYAKYYMNRVEISKNGSVQELSPINIPGWAIALNDGIAVTAEAVWTDEQARESSIGFRLNTLEIRDDRAYLLGQLDLSGDLEGFAMNDSAIYLLRDTRETKEDDQGETLYCDHRLLRVIDLTNPSSLEVVRNIDLGGGYWTIEAVTEETLLLGNGPWDGFAIFDLADPTLPEVAKFVIRDGWGSTFLGQSNLYLTNGRYGIQVVPY